MSIHGFGGSLPPKAKGGVGDTPPSGPAPTPPTDPTVQNTEDYITQLRDWVNGTSSKYSPSTQTTAKSYALYYLDSVNSNLENGSVSPADAIANLGKVIVNPDAQMLQTMAIMGQSLSTYEGISGTLQTAMEHLNDANASLTQIEAYQKTLQSQIDAMPDGSAKQQAESLMAGCVKTIQADQAAIATLTAEVTNSIKPFLSNTLDPMWTKITTDFASFVKNESATGYQTITTDHNAFPNWLTPEQTAFIQGSGSTMGVNQVFNGISGLENGLINVDRKIHGGSAPTPTPWPSPTTKPTPPTNITNGTVMDFVRAAQSWLQAEEQLTPPKFSPAIYKFLSNYLNTIAGEVSPTYDKTALTNYMNQVMAVVINPSAQMTQAIDIIAPFETNEAAYVGKLQGLINRMGMIKDQISKDQAAIAKFTAALSSVTDPALKQKIQGELNAATAALNSSLTTLSQCTSEQAHLEGLITSAGNLNSQMLAAFDQMVNNRKSPGIQASALKQMQAIQAEFPKFDSDAIAVKVLATMNTLSTNLTTTEDSIIAARKEIPNYPPPPNLPPGQMYLQSAELSGLFAKGVDSKSAIDAYLAKLKSANINVLDIAFAQVSDIENLVNGDAKAISQFSTTFAWIAGNPANFKTFATEAKAQGFKMDVSFGGEDGTKTTWGLPPGKTGAQVADDLYNYFAPGGDLLVSNFDFDIETTSFSEANPPGVMRAFFQELHSKVTAAGIGGGTTLTAMGSVTDWVQAGKTRGPLYDLFFDESTQPPKPTFTTMFNGLNLMMYSQTDYYLDASNKEGDSIEDWLDIIGKQNADMLHIGFEDNVPYTAGHSPIWAPTEGQAAAMQYEKLLSKLAADGYIDSTHQLGGAFFWPDSNINKMGQVPETDFETDFYNELNRWNWINR